ncbi:hypothetical protein HYT02_05780 [Candidatus Gottesmanbacteria bacterium]|nr:hypothetical protein [Candidatus Gottesmanbacteria bacterium]
MINKNSALWSYLSEGQKGLIETGEFLLADAKDHQKPISDFSYIVFPIAKAYEGFLKQLFLDMGFISKEQYESDRFRVGRELNPNFAKERPDISVYLKIVKYCNGQELADNLWNAWKRGRNLLFHYFPHNQLKVTLESAEEAINLIISAMEQSFASCNPSQKYATVNT